MTRPRAARIRVLVVEDSPVAATLLEAIIANDPGLEVAGLAGSGEQALALMPRLRPDIVLMDVNLPGIDGVETARRIMQTQPTPIVVTSASLQGSSVTISMEALKAGALSVVEKPLAMRRADFGQLARKLCNQLLIMSQVRVVRQRQLSGQVSGPALADLRPSPPPGLPPQARPGGAGYRMLGMVASTGGPNALAKVLGALPADFPLPVTVVQHIGADFTAGFADWLDSQVAMPVRLARHGERPVPGAVYVAPGEQHLTVPGGILALADGPPESGQRPSGTVLFRSMAQAFGEQAIGVLLTGMGDDGASGLLNMRLAGALTFAEDESTAVIYGMPAVAWQIGAVHSQWPLDGMGAQILRAVKGTAPS